MQKPHTAAIALFAFAWAAGAGVVITPAKDDTRDVCGPGVTATEVLKKHQVTAPISVRAFSTALGHYSSR